MRQEAIPTANIETIMSTETEADAPSQSGDGTTPADRVRDSATGQTKNGDTPSKKDRLLSCLREELAESNGEFYFKGKHISEEVDLSAQEIGQLLIRIQGEVDDFTIEKWGETSGTTWKVAG